MANNPLIIGLTGSFGSGCSYIAELILAKNGFLCYSLSDVLKEMFKSETGKNPKEVPRRELQDYGDKKRAENEGDYFAQIIVEEIFKKYKDESTAKFAVEAPVTIFRVYCIWPGVSAIINFLLGVAK